MESTDIIRKAITIEPKKIVEVIRAGEPSVTTEAQKAYKQARTNLFSPHIRFSPELVSSTLDARSKELDEAIANSPLKGLTDRNGYPLNSLKEFTSLAQQELSGKLNAKTILKRQLEMITDEEELLVRDKANSLTREGVTIGKNGSILVWSFPNQNARDVASIEAQERKQDFLKGKQRLQDFTSGLE